ATVEVAAAAERLADALARADAAVMGERVGRLVGTLHVAVTVLEGLEGSVPEEAREAIRRAIDSIDRVPDIAPAPGTRPPAAPRDEATSPPERPTPPSTGAPGGAPVSPATTAAPESPSAAPETISPAPPSPASAPPAPQRP
ncbi:MAG: hypothetical protein ACRDGE_11095, partial [Candidatus Limnocylindria bacterium]